jgi:hypothetical protein
VSIFSSNDFSVANAMNLSRTYPINAILYALFDSVSK